MHYAFYETDRTVRIDSQEGVVEIGRSVPRYVISGSIPVNASNAFFSLTLYSIKDVYSCMSMHGKEARGSKRFETAAVAALWLR